MKKLFFAANLLLAAAVSVGNYCYHTAGGLTIKAACSAGFVCMGLINLLYALLFARRCLKFALPMVSGLILGMLGDIFLTYDFVTGAALFAAGHIGCFIAQCALSGLHRRDVAVCGLLSVCAVALLLLHPAFSFRSAVIRRVCIVYALIISMMTGKAASALIAKRSFTSLLLALGGALFFFSDFMLSLRLFAHAGPKAGVLCMATYYPAQCLLAVSVLSAAAAEKNTNRPLYRIDA